jgi:asparagine synthetase B (glutamine-hydrolysing)
VTDHRHGGPLDGAQSARYLLDRYLRDQDGFLDAVDGHYLIAVDDGRSGDTLLAASHGSHSGGYVYETADGSSSWSTALQLLADATKAKVDRGWEDFMLLYGFYPYDSTPFESIRHISPGHIWRWHRGTSTITPLPKPRPWGDSMIDGLEDAPPEVAADRLYASFMRALEEQAPTDRPVAVLLGGFDSALVAAGLRRLGVEVETFTFRYEESEYNQPHTETLSDHLGTKHHWIPVGAEDIARGLYEYGLDFSTVTSWPNYVIQTRVVAERIRERGFDSVFSGDGCDYLFFGYPLTFRRSGLINRLPTVPRSLNRALTSVAGRRTLDRLLGRPFVVGMGILRALERKGPERSLLTMRVFDEVSLDNLRSTEPPIPHRDAEEVLRDLAKPYAGLDATRIAYLGKLFLAPYRIKMAGSSQATGLAFLTPYLHAGMAEVALRLPSELLRPTADQGGTKTIGKYALALAAERAELLPREIIYQPKLGAVDAPLVDWFAGPVRQTLLDLFKELPFEASDSYVRRLLKPKRSEALYAKAISRETSNLVSISNGVSLLATYASLTMTRK